MKIQSLSNQNFTGTINYINNKGIVNEYIAEYLSSANVADELTSIQKIVEKKPYNLYIKDFNGMHEFRADTSKFFFDRHVAIVKRMFVYNNVLKESFIEASKEAMKAFEEMFLKKHNPTLYEIAKKVKI